MCTLYDLNSFVAYSSSHSALDGIPFRIGSSFTQKHKVSLVKIFSHALIYYLPCRLLKVTVKKLICSIDVAGLVYSIFIYFRLLAQQI